MLTLQLKKLPVLTPDSIKTVRLHLRLDCFYHYDLSFDFFCIFLRFFQWIFFSLPYMTTHRRRRRNMHKLMTFTCSNKFGDFVREFNASCARSHRMKVQNFVSIQFFASIYFAFHFARRFVLFHFISVLRHCSACCREFPLQKHTEESEQKKTIKFNSRYWVNVWLNVMLVEMPSIEIKTRFGIKASIACQNLCVSILFMLEKFFFLSLCVLASVSFIFRVWEWERDPVEFIVFVGVVGFVGVLSHRSFHSTISSVGSGT